MYQATLTSQGQITVPIEARKRVGFDVGDKLLVLPIGEHLELIKDEGGIESLRGVFAKYAIGKPRFTKKVLEKAREELYTERYRRFLKQDEKKNDS
jgi:bifunctional DNA-binding transcriptional regulator/antitoxin component of YhaV-PrlF toxin-antitoxin module